MAGGHRSDFTNENGRCQIHEDCVEGLICLTFSQLMRVSMIIIYINTDILYSCYTYTYCYIYGNVLKAVKEEFELQEVLQNRLQDFCIVLRTTGRSNESQFSTGSDIDQEKRRY